MRVATDSHTDGVVMRSVTIFYQNIVCKNLLWRSPLTPTASRRDAVRDARSCAGRRGKNPVSEWASASGRPTTINRHGPPLGRAPGTAPTTRETQKDLLDARRTVGCSHALRDGLTHFAEVPIAEDSDKTNDRKRRKKDLTPRHNEARREQE